MGELKKKYIAVTGASGYLGRYVVQQMLDNGHRVRAIVRPNRDLGALPWMGHELLDIVEVDFQGNSENYRKILKNHQNSGARPQVVVHLAGLLNGSDEQHAKETIEPTRKIVEAMDLENVHRLIHVSSMSVYGYVAMPDGGQLDETTPLEVDLSDRDSYCRAKCAQEKILVRVAQSLGFSITVLRPGVIYGPGRVWSPRLGVAINNLILNLSNSAILPISFVENCANAVELASVRDSVISDVYISPELSKVNAGLEVINVVDDHLPTQGDYIDKLSREGAFPYKYKLTLPWVFIRKLADVVSLCRYISPKVYFKLPGLLKKSSLHARMKNLRYSNARLHDRLNWSPKYTLDMATKLISKQKV